MDIKKILLENGFLLSKTVEINDLEKISDKLDDFIKFLKDNNILLIDKKTILSFIDNHSKSISLQDVKQTKTNNKSSNLSTIDKHIKKSGSENKKNKTRTNSHVLKKESNYKSIIYFLETNNINTSINTKKQNTSVPSKTIDLGSKQNSNIGVNNSNKISISNTSSSLSVILLENRLREIGNEVELNVEPLKVFDLGKKELSIYSWANYFIKRLNHLRMLLRKHNIDNYISSLKHLDVSKDDRIAISGLIYDKKPYKNGYIYILEDVYRKIKVYVPKEVKNFEDIPRDSVVTFIGRYDTDKKSFFAEDIIFPDIPIKQTKKLDIEEDVWVAFTGDFQIGNKFFLKKEFERFLLWLQGRYGSDKYKKLAKNVGYILITGDLVDGVGLYPYQENELEIKTIEGQYKFMEKYLLSIPPEKQIVIIPGNHDIPRLAEPQPPIPNEYMEETSKLDNFYYFSNPSYFNIHYDYTVLMYHGYSFDWFVSHIPYIRNNGGYDNPGNIMKFILMLRHLSPDHNAIPYSPTYDFDPLIIDPVPDAFVTGHIHRTYYGVYKGVEMINASCFQGLTPYQLETGHIPDPAKVILRNLRTGEVRILDFSKNL